MNRSIYSLRAMLIHRRFTSKPSLLSKLLLSIIDGMLDVIDRVKYRKMLKMLDERVKEYERVGQQLNEVLKHVESNRP
jgi:hypothetical protein